MSLERILLVIGFSAIVILMGLIADGVEKEAGKVYTILNTLKTTDLL